jgi:glycosyltransferase involved in cell wall biosynthesis
MNISVIIPSFNRAHTLARAIESVLAQSLPADEIILIDDGSRDETQALAQTFPKVTYLMQPNQGVSSARNKGILQAKGNWIALLDSDDEWLPDKLKQQCQLLSQQPKHRLCHGNELWVHNGQHLNQMAKHQKYGGHIFEKCLPLCAISPSAALIQKDLLLEVGLFDTELPACEDYDLWLKICAKEAVLFVEEPVLKKYGGHDDQLSKKHWGMDRFRIKALYNILQSGQLTPDQQHAAKTVLIKKATLFAKGARKRNRLEDAQYYEHLARTYHEPIIQT